MSDTLTSLTETLLTARESRDELKQALAKAEERYRKCSEEFIQYCKANDVDGIKAHGKNIYYSTTPRSRVVDTDKAFQYFRDNNLGHIIKESIHNKTLNSVVKELLNSGQLDTALTENVGLSVFEQEVINIRSV